MAQRATQKMNDAERVTNLIADTLLQVSRWGANLTVERISAQVIRIDFDDGSPSVTVRASLPKPERERA